MKTKQIKIFSFEELTNSAKDYALNQFRHVNVEYFDWYHCVYDDAKTIGIQITGFDLDRRFHCTGKFLSNHCSIDVANKIMEEHGKDCETYKIAEKFLQDYNNLSEDDEVIEIDDKFLNDILKEYLTLLKNEFEYHTSDDAISEWIINHDIVFDEFGEEIKHELI